MISIGVVAHTTRSGQAKQLAKTVKADFVSIDNGVLGCDGNHDHVHHHLANLPTTWSVILEDDAQPIPGFREQLGQALPLSPSPIVSFYLGRQRPPWAMSGVQTAIADAEQSQADWIISTHLLHAVAYAIRTDLIASLLNFASHWPIDQHITAWAQTYGHTVAYPYPSLVDHKDDGTLFDHPDGQPRPPGRKAWKTSPHSRWSTRTVPLRIT